MQTTDEPRVCARVCLFVCLFVRGTVRRRLHDAVVRADHAKPGTKRPPHLQQQGHATCNKYTESSGQRAALQRTTCNMQHGEVGAQRPSHRDIARRLRHNRKPALALQDHKQPPARTHLLRHSVPCASAAAGGAPTRCMRPSPLRQNPARARAACPRRSGTVRVPQPSVSHVRASAHTSGASRPMAARDRLQEAAHRTGMGVSAWWDTCPRSPLPTRRPPVVVDVREEDRVARDMRDSRGGQQVAEPLDVRPSEDRKLRTRVLRASAALPRAPHAPSISPGADVGPRVDRAGRQACAHCSKPFASSVRPALMRHRPQARACAMRRWPAGSQRAVPWPQL